MKLEQPSNVYNLQKEIERNRRIEASDRGNHKRNADVEIGDGRLIIKSPNGTRYKILVDNSGNLSASTL